MSSAWDLCDNAQDTQQLLLRVHWTWNKIRPDKSLQRRSTVSWTLKTSGLRGASLLVFPWTRQQPFLTAGAPDSLALAPALVRHPLISTNHSICSWRGSGHVTYAGLGPSCKLLQPRQRIIIKDVLFELYTLTFIKWQIRYSETSLIQTIQPKWLSVLQCVRIDEYGVME